MFLNISITWRIVIDVFILEQSVKQKTWRKKISEISLTLTLSIHSSAEMLPFETKQCQLTFYHEKLWEVFSELSVAPLENIPAPDKKISTKVLKLNRTKEKLSRRWKNINPIFFHVGTACNCGILHVNGSYIMTLSKNKYNTKSDFIK